MEANLEPVHLHSLSGSIPERSERYQSLDWLGQQSQRDASRLRCKARPQHQEDRSRSSEARWITPEEFGVVIAGSQIQDRLEKVQFFQKPFLSANTSMEVVPGMPFLTPKSTALRFGEKELVWSTYTAAETLPATRIVDIIDKKFAAAALNRHDEGFVVHIFAILRASTKMTIHPS